MIKFLVILTFSQPEGQSLFFSQDSVCLKSLASRFESHCGRHQYLRCHLPFHRQHQRHQQGADSGVALPRYHNEAPGVVRTSGALSFQVRSLFPLLGIRRVERLQARPSLRQNGWPLGVLLSR
jgi:hypothetical protein